MIDRRGLLTGVAAIAGTAAATVTNSALASNRRSGGSLTQGSLMPEPRFPLPESGLRPGSSARDVLGVASRATGHLRMYNVHTQERLSVNYRGAGQYDQTALQRLDYFFRDWRADAVRRIDPHVLDLLSAIQASVGSQTPLHILSGYRSSQTNAWLAQRNHDVARNSLHIQGKAIDIVVPGYDLAALHRSATSLRGGGVGYYPASGFIHVDTGPLRHW